MNPEIDKETNKPTLFKILSTLLIVVVVFSLIYTFRTSLKKFFGFATVYYSVDGNKAVANGWVVSTSSSAVHYAWSESAGWIDFAPTNGKVYVADDGLWGYAYGENIGWISLNCHNDEQNCSHPYGVTNNAEGRLSGFAWGENVGWIDFGATTTGSRPYGVSIDSAGDFHGYAYGESIGWISFNSQNLSNPNIDYRLSTNWRAFSLRSCLAPDGVTSIPNGSSVSYYASSTVPHNQVCSTPQVRTCTDSVLSGSYTHTSCTVASLTDCIGPDTADIPNGNSKTYYSSRTVAVGQTCVSESRTCTNNVLTGSYAYSSCSVLAKNGKHTVSDNTTSTSSVNTLVTAAATTTNSNPASSIATSTITGVPAASLAPISTVSLPAVVIPQALKLADLPTFNDTKKDSFTFVPQITSFLFAPLPEPVTTALNSAPRLKDRLAALGFSKNQDLATIINAPILLTPDASTTGMFIVTTGSTTLKAYLTTDSSYKLIETVRVASGTPIVISLIPTKAGNVSGLLNNKPVRFTQDGKYVKASFISGTLGKYNLTTTASPLTLSIEVIAPALVKTNPITSIPWISKVLGWFGL